ncbi:O-methyltransferase ZRP4-like [Phragmites australis]|uniref:O-methyltransferase ZRP4-like n=1 Tax=Phragmites australis TaxID=29695 RepID=UPI002D76FED9|nr:O-methyltransferase ZRP4-like [Phragmites australis]
MALTPCTGQALLDAQLDLWHSNFAYVKSMALKAALDLRIADAIQHHGGAATLLQVATNVTVPQAKIPCLRRLMRVLTATGVFGAQAQHPSARGGEPVYTLTPTSRLLVGSGSLDPITAMIIHPALVSSFFELGAWLQRELPDPCIFKLRNGQTMWELADRDATFDALINNGMASDSRFVMDIVIKEHGEIFEGISTLIDVAGGLGGAAQAISKAFPHVKSSVLDLDHVVAMAPKDTCVQYIAGDMFESVPPADTVFLKWVLHDWGDEKCVKILKNCREAIPARDAGGKVIILDMVVGAGPPDLKNREMQVVFDLYMVVVNGIERDEQEWKKIIFEAGFSDYKIKPVLGARSVIEVYP